MVRIWGPIGRRRPETPPPGFPVWPLWHAALAFVHTRRAGALLVAGLALGVLVR
ncbi:MAG: 1,4-dihydroxy-2-naphthoate prenyltransferase [Acidimicrobiia bacterium]